MFDIAELIRKHKIIAISRRIPADKAVDTAQALWNGGIRMLEVTFDQNDPDCIRTTSGMIAAISKSMGDKMSVGAGTVMNRQQAKAAADAGAKYVLAPNVNPDVIDEALKLGIAAIPGALTPTEIAFAYSLGAPVVKLFPAGDLGLGYLKSLRGPLNHIPLIAVGGIDENNLNDYLKAGAAGAGIGSNIVKNSLIEQSRFDDLTKLAQIYTSNL